MSQATAEDGIYRADAYTPAYLALLSNMVRIALPILVYDVSHPDPQAIQITLEKTLPLAKDPLLAVPTALEVLLEWQAVMLVTITEAYVQDVLAFAAERDPAHMKDSHQAASYQDVVQAESLTGLSDELRRRWARNFLEDGGPQRWIERFERMGARGFRAGVAETMELHWGVRHVVVHNASKATPEFVKRHPAFGAVVGQPIEVGRPMLSNWFDAIQNFSETVERFMYNRFLGTPEQTGG